LDRERLSEFISISQSLGLSCLVEAHDELEIEKALSAGAKIIGVNNRDLRTFDVDLGNSKRLRKLVPKELAFVSESGVNCRDDVLELAKFGVDAVLVGEAAVKARDRIAFLKELKGNG
jgi:indole-3-glycerol phosphate synthase